MSYLSISFYLLFFLIRADHAPCLPQPKLGRPDPSIKLALRTKTNSGVRWYPRKSVGAHATLGGPVLVTSEPITLYITLIMDITGGWWGALHSHPPFVYLCYATQAKMSRGMSETERCPLGGAPPKGHLSFEGIAWPLSPPITIAVPIYTIGPPFFLYMLSTYTHTIYTC